MISKRIYIGIDPGTSTGFAVWDRTDRRFLCIATVKIHEAMDRILKLKKEFPENIYVRFEDAKQRRWLGPDAAAKQQGAGSIKRDCSIWYDFLTDHQIPFEQKAPGKGLTKWPEDYFQKVTKYRLRTSEHGRDAAVLVFDN